MSSPPGLGLAIAGSAFLLVGLAVLVVGLRSLWAVRVRRSRWRTYPAQVVGQRWRGGGDRSLSNFVVRWTDETGAEHESVDPHGVSWGTLRSFPFETTVHVDPEDPTRGISRQGMGRGGCFGPVAVLAGLAFTLIGASLLAHALDAAL